MKRIRVLSAGLIVLAVGGASVARAQDDRGRQAGRAQRAEQERVPPQAEHRRVQQNPQNAQNQQTNDPYRRRAEQQSQALRDQNTRIQQANREAQERARQEYAARLREAQLQQSRINRDYDDNPFANRSASYRYNMGGVYRQTSRYGADMLRQAVNNGYLEGVRAGQLDRQDRWPPNFASSPAYRDASDGYTGNYVARSDYTYYFRQGFQRGYDDGYYGRSQYGSYSNGNGSILGNILSSILGLESIR